MRRKQEQCLWGSPENEGKTANQHTFRGPMSLCGDICSLQGVRQSRRHLMADMECISQVSARQCIKGGQCDSCLSIDARCFKLKLELQSQA